jgi:hypothetical protein
MYSDDKRIFLRLWKQVAEYAAENRLRCSIQHHPCQESSDDQKFLSIHFPIRGDYYRE